jgi:predicted PurR-regulated permease PerM
MTSEETPAEAGAIGQTSDESRWHAPLVRASDWAWRSLVVLALVAVVVAVGVRLAAIVVPALLAVVVVPVGRPLMVRLGKRLNHSLAAALVVLIALSALGAAGWLMVTALVANWNDLWVGIADAISAVMDWIDEQVTALSDEQIATMRENLSDLVRTTAGVVVGGATKSVAVIGGFLVGMFLFVVTFFFGVRDWDEFRAWVLRSVRPRARRKSEHFLDRFEIVLRRYWKSQAYIGVFDALAVGIGLAIIGVPLALPIAVFTLVISFIPYVGAVVSTALAVLVALGTEGNTAALLALILCLFTFNTGENLMRPWLVGETVKMRTFIALIAGTAGVLVAGALGAILAIPLVALAGEARRIFFTVSAHDGRTANGAAPVVTS